jgi:formimidoylglutamate deiminase
MADYFTERAWLPQGWAEDVHIAVDDATGDLTAVRPGAAPDGCTRLHGPVIPGVPNVHSHAFQRAMAGLAEHAPAGTQDSFWTWREAMYALCRKLTPEQVEAVASQLYVEMLKGGYTAVGEFHYLHHDSDGQPYGDLAEMAWRVLAAARRTGIGITLLPALYGYGGFGAEPPGDGQKRFVNEPERLLRLLQQVHAETEGDPQVRLGLAPHSLRAVTPETLRDGVAGLRALDPTAPVHIHAAEQRKEVDACLDWSRSRPVQWLLAQPGLVDDRWCLIHCTHVTEREVAYLAERGCVVGLCPTTEANLGDGVFPAARFVRERGRFAVGSDSQVAVSPASELRMLEYGQRLVHERRNVLAGGEHDGSTGANLLAHAMLGGRRALGRKIGQLVPGARADFLVLDAGRPPLAGVPPARLLDAFVFGEHRQAVRDVFVAGRQVIDDGRHPREAEILLDFKTAMAELAEA